MDEEKRTYQCAKCDELNNLHRCGPLHDSYYLCIGHLEELMNKTVMQETEDQREARLEREAIVEESKPDFLSDLANGVIK